MDSSFLPFNKLLKNEFTTLERIASDPIFTREFVQLSADAKDYLLRNEKQRNKKTLTEFNFQSVINDITMNGRSGTAYIGALIKVKNGSYDQLTYYFALCDNKKLIRKFHFDYAPKDMKARVPHPVFHLQYPGEMPTHLLSLDLKHDHLESALSEPRIPFTPMSLALIINLILKEFPNERTHKACEDKTWRDLIKTNEKSILAPYFKTCHTFFTQSPGPLFTSDFCYGKE